MRPGARMFVGAAGIAVLIVGGLTTRARAPARLIVAATPVSSPAAATARGTEPGVVTSRPSTTKLMATSTAAVALG
jgi:hypothetical protein